MSLDEIPAGTPLAFLPGIPCGVLLRLLESENVLYSCSEDAKTLNGILGLESGIAFTHADLKDALTTALREFEKARDMGGELLTPFSEGYPKSLLRTANFPKTLYKVGAFDLNSLPGLAVVGTRRCTAYGDSFTRRAVADLAHAYQPCCIVSGLAYGIDATAHAAALESGLPTVAVMANGLDTIYPSAHRNLAAAICRSGGALLSEYSWGEHPQRQRFLERNRIVAGMSVCTLVVESAVRGGALSTAAHAHDAGRPLLALPGRVTDIQSEGCNRLIATHKASAVTCAADIARTIGLAPKVSSVTTSVPSLFPMPEGEQKNIFNLLQGAPDPMQLDEICLRTGLSAARVSALLSDMEFDSMVTRHPGNRFSV